MPPYLGRGNHPALGLDGAGPQQHLPVRLARRDREGGRVGQDLGPGDAAGRRLGEGQRRLGKAQVEADEAAHAADGGVEGRGEALAGTHDGALTQGAVVEEVQLVVGGGVVDGAVGADPEGAVVEARADGGARLGRHELVDGHVDADVDVDAGFLCCGLDAEDEGGPGLGLGEREGFFPGRGDVVCCLGQEENLAVRGELASVRRDLVGGRTMCALMLCSPLRRPGPLVQ